MATAKDIALSILNFSSPEYEVAPNVDLIMREQALLQSDFTGVAINAPTKVGSANFLPMAICSRFDGARSWDVPIGKNAFLVATNLASGKIYVTNPFMSGKDLSRVGDRELHVGDRPPEEQLETIGAQIAWIMVPDVRVPLEPGHWTFTLIYFDWLSNRHNVEVKSDAPSLAAPPDIFPQPSGTDAFPTFLKRGSTPTVDGTYGVVFDMRTPVEEGKTTIYVTGSYKLKARASMAADQESINDQGEQKSVATVVRMSVILLERNNDQPHEFRLAIPVYGAKKKPGAWIEGYFTLNLLDSFEYPPLSAGNYAAYLAVDGVVYGPHTFDVPAP